MLAPVGRTLLIGYSIGNVSVEEVAKPLLRLFAMPVLTVLLIAYVQKNHPVRTKPVAVNRTTISTQQLWSIRAFSHDEALEEIRCILRLVASDLLDECT